MPPKRNSDDSFEARMYLRSLSYRDFFTSLSNALLLIAVFEVINYFSFNDWVFDHSQTLKLVNFFLAILMNHAWYKLEHKRANNYVGRIMHDYIFILLVLVMTQIRFLILHGEMTMSSDVGTVMLMIFVSLFFLMILEFLVAIVKRILNLVKWRIM